MRDCSYDYLSFFFKQKTAYEMRISDWSSDVCSSDLILIGPDGPIFLDAECAWYGDPAFDLAFCLNHLLLKCLWTPRATAGFLSCFDALSRRYPEGVDWEPAA